MTDFDIKDSGARQQFESGMVRDTTEGKTDYSLALDGPMFHRLAVHLTKGAQKYAKRNWMQANGQAELDRFRESALRHFLQWFDGDTDEDHAAATFFNINGAEYVRAQLADDPIATDADFEAAFPGRPWAQKHVYRRAAKTLAEAIMAEANEKFEHGDRDNYWSTKYDSIPEGPWTDEV